MPDPTDPRPLGDSLGPLVEHLARARDTQRRRGMVPKPPRARALTPQQLRDRWWQQHAPYATAELEHLEAGLAKRCAAWLAAEAPRPLVLTGKVGAGKTVTACAVARAWYAKGEPAAVAPVRALVDALLARTPDARHVELLRAVRQAKLLVLDELPAMADNGATDVVRDVVDQAQGRGCRIVVTTNLAAAERETPPRGAVAVVEPRLRDRLFNGANVEPVVGPSRRGGHDHLPPLDTELDPCPYDCATGWLPAPGARLVWPEPPAPPPLPPGKGKDGHWHGEPVLCPKCGGIRPDLAPLHHARDIAARKVVGVATVVEAMGYAYRPELDYWPALDGPQVERPCPHCRPTEHARWLADQVPELVAAKPDQRDLPLEWRDDD